jgi:hypothetical protein
MATFIEALLPSVHDTLSLREALSKIARKIIYLKNSTAKTKKLKQKSYFCRMRAIY